jgi:hypothetical protein
MKDISKGGDDDSSDVPMKTGDYMIHLLIQKAKNIISENASPTIEAMFKINTFGKTSYSKVMKGTATSSERPVFWGEHVFMECRSLGKDELAEGMITIKLMDKGLFRDCVIGEFEADITKIYGSNDEHAWKD